MKIIKEDIENLERYIGNKRVDIHAELPLIMADAYSSSKNDQEEIEKELKDSKKEPEIEKKDNKVLGAEKQPVPKMPEEAKINLEESLFEDIFYPHRSADLLTDMIDDGQFDYQDKLEALLKDIIYLVDDDALSRYLKKKGIYSEALREESLFEDYRDKNWKLVEVIKNYINEGHIDKDEFIDKILQWYYMDPTFNSFLITNNIFSEDEMDELIEYHESLKEDSDYPSYTNYRNWEPGGDEVPDYPISFYKVIFDVEGKGKETHYVAAYNERAAVRQVRSPITRYLSYEVIPVTEEEYYDGLDNDFNESLKEDTEEDKYYAALDIPKGPERKKVAAERRQEFIKKHELRDRAQEWKDSRGKDDPEEEADLFTVVNDELFPYDMEEVKLFTKFPNIPAKRRYHDGQVVTDYDGNIVIYANNDEDFDFANRVAQAYSLEITEPRQIRGKKVVKILMPRD